MKIYNIFALLFLIISTFVCAETLQAQAISNKFPASSAELKLTTVTIENEVLNMPLASLTENVKLNATEVENELASFAADPNSSIELLLQEKNYSKVIILLEGRLNKATNWEDYFWLGTAYLMVNSLDDAAFALDFALELKGDIAEIWVQRATVEQEKGNYAAALQLLQVAIQINPKCLEAYLNAAYAYEHLRQVESARAAYGYFLQLSTTEPKFNNLRRKVLSRLSALQANDSAE